MHGFLDWLKSAWWLLPVAGVLFLVAFLVNSCWP